MDTAMATVTDMAMDTAMAVITVIMAIMGKRNEWKENKLLGFAKGEFRVLITKTKIASFGMNYQNCNNYTGKIRFFQIRRQTIIKSK